MPRLGQISRPGLPMGQCQLGRSRQPLSLLQGQETWKSSWGLSQLCPPSPVPWNVPPCWVKPWPEVCPPEGTYSSHTSSPSPPLASLFPPHPHQVTLRHSEAAGPSEGWAAAQAGGRWVAPDTGPVPSGQPAWALLPSPKLEELRCQTPGPGLPQAASGGLVLLRSNKSGLF